MTTRDIRELIGKEIEWDSDSLFVHVHRGVVLEVKSRNVLVNKNGSEDWYWLPDLNRWHVRLAQPVPQDS